MKASERKNKSPSEYYNPYFKRGHPNLLWLINKPKGGTSKVKGKRVKNDEGQDNDSDDDTRDAVDETYGPSYGNKIQASSRAISAAPESGPLQRREIAVVQSQLADIQKQQGAISNAISRLRKDHNQLYQQAIAFQTLHHRHESSINAILTFLATVYNRSLDGQNPQNIAQMFANGIPQDPQHQHQGNVVRYWKSLKSTAAKPRQPESSTQATTAPHGTTQLQQWPSQHRFHIHLKLAKPKLFTRHYAPTRRDRRALRVSLRHNPHQNREYHSTTRHDEHNQQDERSGSPQRQQSHGISRDAAALRERPRELTPDHRATLHNAESHGHYVCAWYE